MIAQLITVATLLFSSTAGAFQQVAGPTSGIVVGGHGHSTSLYAARDANAQPSRRAFFQTIASSSLAIGSLLAFEPQSMVNAAEPGKVLVLGGTGFVGSRVVKKLQGMGIDVVATSRDGRDGTVALDVTTTSDVAKAIEGLAKGCSAVISTIGAIGTDNDLAVNSATGLAAIGAKAAGVSKFVYISVAPEVKEFAQDIEFLKPYMKGKTFSQDAVTSNFGSSSTLIEPTFIYGGDSFGVNPPRVAGFYGEFIEAILSSGPLRAVTNIAPKGFIKIALEPPVSVDAVADAAVAGALGKSESVLDTYDKIVAAGDLV